MADNSSCIYTPYNVSIFQFQVTYVRIIANSKQSYKIAFAVYPQVAYSVPVTVENPRKGRSTTSSYRQPALRGVVLGYPLRHVDVGFEREVHIRFSNEVPYLVQLVGIENAVGVVFRAATRAAELRRHAGREYKAAGGD